MNMRQPQRRRGRGNNNNRSQSNNRNGYDNQNRVDNRARGNAAQMLEKFKKQAQDAQHNGDRVQAEYYFQFADHYFRVLADVRSRQEEGRPAQREYRSDENENGEGRDWRDEERDVREDGGEGEASAEASNDDDYRRPPQRQERNDREDRGNRNNNRNDRYERNDRPERSDRAERPGRAEQSERPETNEQAERPERSERPERNTRSRNNPRRDREPREERPAQEEVGLDLSILPPSIAIASDDSAPEVAEEKPARKPRARRPKTANDDVEVAAAE
jgi:Domain of unknown function (DUF4167)